MRFFADSMLGKLARTMRMLGEDVEWVGDSRQRTEALQKADKSRILLTRDGKLAACDRFATAICIESDNPARQVQEVYRKAGRAFDPRCCFTRCLECNRLLERRAKGEVAGRVPPYVYQTQEEFYECPGCRRLYWEGTHRQHMVRSIELLFK